MSRNQKDLHQEEAQAKESSPLCGNCPHWLKIEQHGTGPVALGQPAVGHCYGAPPSAVIAGVTPQGQPVYMAAYPPVAENNRPCAMHPLVQLGVKPDR